MESRKDSKLKKYIFTVILERDGLILQNTSVLREKEMRNELYSLHSKHPRTSHQLIKRKVNCHLSRMCKICFFLQFHVLILGLDSWFIVAFETVKWKKCWWFMACSKSWLQNLILGGSISKHQLKSSIRYKWIFWF